MLIAMLAVNALVGGTLLLVVACALRCRLGARRVEPIRVLAHRRR
ncbi:MAG: hypothetical protein VW450_00105 [Chloroflexota bacterium]